MLRAISSARLLKSTQLQVPESDKKNATSYSLSNEDYYLNEQGYIVFTEAYHVKRGYCCGNGCKHCPYGMQKEEPTTNN